jgi:hypothetical protein
MIALLTGIALEEQNEEIKKISIKALFHALPFA